MPKCQADRCWEGLKTSGFVAPTIKAQHFVLRVTANEISGMVAACEMDFEGRNKSRQQQNAPVALVTLESYAHKVLLRC